MENAPIPIQLRAPPRTRPTPGIRTRIRRMKQTSKITFEYVRHTIINFHNKNIATTPRPANSNCLLQKE